MFPLGPTRYDLLIDSHASFPCKSPLGFRVFDFMSAIPDSPVSTATPPAGVSFWRFRRKSLWMRFLRALAACAVIWGAWAGCIWFQTAQYRRQCEAARAAEDWRTERDTARRWSEWDPAAGRAWWYAAEAAQKLDDLEDLANCLGRVPESDPQALVAYVEKANLEWTTLNRPLEAIETSRRVLAISPRVGEIQSRLISFYAMNLQRAPLVRSIRAAIAARSEPRECYPYLILADSLSFSNGVDMNSRWLVSSPDEVRFKIGMGVSTAMNLAQNANSSRSPDAAELNREAMRQLQWFLDALPHDPVLLSYLMGRAYEAGDVNRVGELLQAVDESGVDDHMIWVYRAWYHTEMNELPQAEEAIREALRLHVISPLAHHEYARLLRKMQRSQAEIERQQKLAADGKELRANLQRAKSVLDVSMSDLRQIARYAADCGDQPVAAALERRLNSLQLFPANGTLLQRP